MTESEKEFRFKEESVDMNALLKQIAESMAEAIGRNPKSIKCKGIRIFYVDEETESTTVEWIVR